MFHRQKMKLFLGSILLVPLLSCSSLPAPDDPVDVELERMKVKLYEGIGGRVLRDVSDSQLEELEAVATDLLQVTSDLTADDFKRPIAIAIMYHLLAPNLKAEADALNAGKASAPSKPTDVIYVHLDLAAGLYQVLPRPPADRRASGIIGTTQGSRTGAVVFRVAFKNLNPKVVGRARRAGYKEGDIVRWRFDLTTHSTTMTRADVYRVMKVIAKSQGGQESQ